MNLNSGKADESLASDIIPVTAKAASTPTAKLASKINKKPKTNDEFESEISALEERVNEIDKEIDKFERQGYAVNELDIIIDKLHIFNEIKDTAQIIMGKIAELKCKTNKEIHKEYNADLNDS